MIRTQISLTKNQKEDLDKQSLLEGVSISEILRKSLQHYLSSKTQLSKLNKKALANLKGAWAKSNWSYIDSSTWQKKLRKED